MYLGKIRNSYSECIPNILRIQTKFPEISRMHTKWNQNASRMRSECKINSRLDCNKYRYQTHPELTYCNTLVRFVFSLLSVFIHWISVFIVSSKPIQFAFEIYFPMQNDYTPTKIWPWKIAPNISKSIPNDIRTGSGSDLAMCDRDSGTAERCEAETEAVVNEFVILCEKNTQRRYL